MRRTRSILAVAALAAATAILAMAVADPVEAAKRSKYEWTSEFPLGSCIDLVTSTDDGARNRYFILEVGRVWELSNQPCIDAGDCDELEETTITILDETEIVDGVETRVMEEREWVDGALNEVSRNFFVECLGTEDVYYFGEDVEDGSGNPLPDGWRAGMNGASPGVIFPGGVFQIGARYYQELAPGVALDRAENVAMGFDISVPAGSFQDCVLVWDDNALDNPKSKAKNLDEKTYCEGIGFVTDEEMVLVDRVDP